MTEPTQAMSKHVKSLFKHFSKERRVSDSLNLFPPFFFSCINFLLLKNTSRHGTSTDGDSHSMVNRCSHMPVPLPTQCSSSSGHTRAIVAWHSDLPQAPCSCKSVCPTPGLCGSLATSSTHKQRRTLGALFQQSQRGPLLSLLQGTCFICKPLSCHGVLS